MRLTLFNKMRKQEVGRISFLDFKHTVKYDLVDYLTSGMQMAMVLCIDFTRSNLDQTSPASLHYHTKNVQSQYYQAIQQVGSIVLEYDTDKLVPCYGFGAKVNMPNFSSHDYVHNYFPLNGSEENPNLLKMPGIEEGYRNCLPHIKFSGPTYIVPLLK